MRKFAISDIHGCHRTFLELLDRIAFSTLDQLYLLGDYVDRGPGSRQVLDAILYLLREGYQVRALMGNHDLMMVRACEEPGYFWEWSLGWGGLQTLKSFQAGSCADIPGQYKWFLKNLEWFILTDEFLLVHAGFNFKNPDPLSDLESMLFIRNWHDKIDYEWLNGRFIVHGHTPITIQDSMDMLQDLPAKKVIDIDTGCFMGSLRPGMGFLAALDLTNLALVFQKNLDDMSGYWNNKLSA